mmetsp:Transcript_33016/g.65027  ORF Transcript_33016/g.65027 Transcript_33016/m.65027 type:complete len:255 (-) Transcript_33016:157-921(-)
MCRSSGSKDLARRPGVCLTRALSGRRCFLQNCPKRDLSTTDASATSAKTSRFGSGDARLLGVALATPAAAAAVPSLSALFFFFSSLSFRSCSASMLPLCSTKNASIRGSNLFSNGLGGIAWTLEARVALVAAESREDPSARTADGTKPWDSNRCAGVALTSVSSRRSRVWSKAVHNVSTRASSKKPATFKSFSVWLLDASLKTSARVRTTRKKRVSIVEGSAVVASHLARAASMSVTREASTRMSSARTISKCA